MTTRYWPVFTPAPTPAAVQGCAPAGAVSFGTCERLYAQSIQARAEQRARILAELHAPTATRYLEIA